MLQFRLEWEEHTMHVKRVSNCRMTTRLCFVSTACAIVVCVHTINACAAVPAAPLIGPSWFGRDGASVHFTPPASDGGKAITSYMVTSSPENKGVTGTSSPIIVPGLTFGVANTFTVKATNDDGTSVPSAPSGNVFARPFAPASGILNNLVLFIRFSDQPAFTQPLSYYTALFNSDPKSLKNFYRESSYTTLTVNSIFPAPSLPNLSTDGFSYVDPHPSSYYAPYNVSSNPAGYLTAPEGAQRETELVSNALGAIKDQIPGGLELDGDNDGFIDHITFEVYSSLLNPQPVKFYSRSTYDTSASIVINGKHVGSYTWIAASQDSPEFYLASVEIHEMGHSFGYPDLRGNGGRTPVGDWDVMSMSKPVHSGAYLKNKFTGWVASIPEISSYGTYSIQDLAQDTDNSYKISIPGTHEFLVLEYRKAAGVFESNLPGSGLCITRVNEAAGIWGNLGGPPFFLYYFRPGGTFESDGSNSNSFACLNAESGRIQFNDVSTPPCFLSDGSSCGISIDNIGTSGGPLMTFTFADPATTVVKRLISGFLSSGGNRISGATVTLSGDASGVTTTDNLGRYLFTVNSGGNYVVTPTKANLTFTPSNKSFSAVTSDQIQNFPATNNTHTISGTITSSGNPLSGVTVTCSGGNYPFPVTTDVTGGYSCIVYAGFDYDVRATKTNYFLAPNKKIFTNVTSDQVQDFASWTSPVNLSGTISYNGTPLSGISVSCPGANTTPVITSGSGSYTFTVMIGNGSVYTITPSTPVYRFSPSNQFYAWQSSQVMNFTAIYTPTLDLTFAGSGGGTISDGGVYNCHASPCPTVSYSVGDIVELYAVADTNSLFSFWSANCGSTANGACAVKLDAPKSITATFDRLQWA